MTKRDKERRGVSARTMAAVAVGKGGGMGMEAETIHHSDHGANSDDGDGGGDGGGCGWMRGWVEGGGARTLYICSTFK